MKNLFLIFIAILSAGCWAKSSLHSQANLKNELLAYTQKYDKDGILLVATYLNPIYQGEFVTEFEGSDIFIVSIYPTHISPTSIDINSHPALIQKLSPNDKLTSLTSINMPWSNHYKVSLTAQEANILELNISLDNNSTANLKFQKVSRSLYWNTK